MALNAAVRTSTAVPVTLAEDITKLAQKQNRTVSEILRSLTEEFLARNAARLEKYKDLPVQKQRSTTLGTHLWNEDATNLKLLATADSKTTSQIIREEAEKFVEANRALLAE